MCFFSISPASFCFLHLEYHFISSAQEVKFTLKGPSLSFLLWRLLRHHSKKKKNSDEVAQSCLTLCNPMDCSLPGSSIHGIFQAKILEWTAISFSRGSSQPRDRTQVPCIAGRRFTVWATREPLFLLCNLK